MDAHEDDGDIKLQKASSELIAEFSRSLPLFLRKPDGKTLRARVRVSETSRLTSSLLDPFQELPQLLDPHLPEWLPLLASTYLEHLNTRTRTRARPSASTRSQLLEPLSLAIAKIIYYFTKIRGEKVIVRFLNVESRHIEPLLSALEASEHASSTARPALNSLSSPQSSSAVSVSSPGAAAIWSWEERYLVLLWLSHLLLAPFDLSTISSASADPDLTLPSIPDFDWPEDLPGITVRILPIAIKYLASSGKERDGARALLVRVAMRRDMQSQGVLSALVRWSLASLKTSPSPSSSDAATPAPPPQPPYFYIGVLSFLAGVLRSSINTSDMDAYLSPIFLTAHAVASAEGAPDTTVAAAPSVSTAIRSVAVARKMLIKVIRSVTVLLLRSNKAPSDQQSTDELVEMSIGYLLESLADNDTPVRLAASKALSIVTLKLDPDMASQVVDAVLDSLNRNVFWTRDPGTSKGTSSSANTTTSTRDLTAVDPLEWHGLMLTLSHLLYRRSPPASQLPSIVHGLLLGLSFEKRSTSGGSIGTNVRDAACFGIWALARRYTTPELLHVPTASVVAARSYHNPSTSSNASSNVSASSVSILQVLATELTVTASLDPAGNIRRGASAALQELIGRHPDTVEKGIWVVQAVDYHTVALRSRAVHDVALSATKLSSQYGVALLDGLLGWRGIGDADVVSRRVAGASFGTLTLELARQTTASASASAASSSTSPSGDHNDDGSVAQFTASIDRVLARLRTLQTRQVDERHGLVLCLASVLDKFPELVVDKPIDTVITEIAHRIIRELESLFTEFQTTTYRRPELIAEAYSRLITSSFPILQATSSPSSQITNLEPGYKVVSTNNTKSLLDAIKTLDAQDKNNKIPDSIVNLVSTFHPIVSAGLTRTEKEAVAASSEAGLVLLVFSPAEERKRIVTEWAGAVRQRPTSRAASDTGTLFALTMAYSVTTTFGGTDRSIVCDTILARWASDNDIDTRVAILQALSQSGLLRDQALVFLDLLAEGLNDYTTNARGDVGSHVRLEALKATKSLWTMALGVDRSHSTGDDDDGIARENNSNDNKMDWLPEAVSKLFLRILRLAAEKLDRVRTEAHAVLALTVESSFATTFTKLTFSSKPYFKTLLNLYATDNSLQPPIAEPARADKGAWMAELLAGYVTSADTGNEDLVIASRAALADFCATSPRNLDAVCAALVSNVKTRQQQTPGQSQGQGDRVVVPTLEIVAFLCHVGLFQQCREVDLRHLCLQVQKAGYKTGNVRKLEACIKVYGCVAGFDLECAGVKEEGEEILRGKRRDGISEARKRLGALMFHPWPRVRSLVVDELWKLFGEEDKDGSHGGGAESLKSVDWSKADKASINRVVDQFALSRAA
ncbi:beta-tubulin cofactor d [Colletotrichum godetiae]|uniref:Beta-tubulin cofactor d n=1 Tax=Colletotrichum godetiae TaxID=1209918 RepID=A0AAJ0F3Z3_9PEZI|nr:beta-tubulin cofactor d [Colletotrichum godetiae]KAK1699915.1 beta-tubulin cofactor d [Colletotrichum godetiae]